MNEVRLDCNEWLVLFLNWKLTRNNHRAVCLTKLTLVQFNQPPPPPLSSQHHQSRWHWPLPLPPLEGLIVVQDVPLSRARIICQICGSGKLVFLSGHFIWEIGFKNTKQRRQSANLILLLCLGELAEIRSHSPELKLGFYCDDIFQLSLNFLDWLIPQNWPLPCTIRSCHPGLWRCKNEKLIIPEVYNLVNKIVLINCCIMVTIFL